MLSKRWKHFSRAEAEQDAKSFFATLRTNPCIAVPKTIFYGAIIILLTILTFIVEPYYSIKALTHSVGNQYFALLAGLIVVYRIGFSFIWTFINNMREKKSTSDNKLITTHPAIDLAYQVLYAIPRFYLIYLFFLTATNR